MLSDKIYHIHHQKHHRTHPKTTTQHIKHRIIKKLFFIFYIQIQHQSRAKTTQKSPQPRRNPPFFRYQTSRIGHKNPNFRQKYRHKKPIKHPKTTIFIKLNINCNYKMIYKKNNNRFQKNTAPDNPHHKSTIQRIPTKQII